LSRGVLHDLSLELAEQIDAAVDIADGVDANAVRYAWRTAANGWYLRDRRSRSLEQALEQGILSERLITPGSSSLHYSQPWRACYTKVG
jgi:hypothetical protein